MKPVLFVDIDGTIADSIPWWLTLYNHEHWTSFEKSQLTTYDPRESLKIDLSPFYMDYRGVKVMPGANIALVRLMCYYDVVFVTAGFGSDWLRAQGYSNPIIQIKGRKYLKGYALIDDCQDNLIEFDGKGYLVKQPWNPNGLTWEEITEALIDEKRDNASAGVLVSPV